MHNPSHFKHLEELSQQGHKEFRLPPRLAVKRQWSKALGFVRLRWPCRILQTLHVEVHETPKGCPWHGNTPGWVTTDMSRGKALQACLIVPTIRLDSHCLVQVWPCRCPVWHTNNVVNQSPCNTSTVHSMWKGRAFRLASSHLRSRMGQSPSSFLGMIK